MNIVVDTNGFYGSNKEGIEVFYLTLFAYKDYADYAPKKGLHFGSISSLEGDFVHNNNWIKEKRCNSTNKQACGLLIQRNGWRIPKDYPIKF